MNPSKNTRRLSNATLSHFDRRVRRPKYSRDKVPVGPFTTAATN